MRRQIDADRYLPFSLLPPAGDISADTAHDRFEQQVRNAYFFAQRDEVRRWHHGSIRPGPASQRFQSCQIASNSALLRLVVCTDLTTLDRLAKLNRQVEFVSCPVTHLTVIISNWTLQSPHRAVQCSLRTAKHALRITTMHWMPGDADAGGQEQFTAVDQERRLDRLSYYFSHIPNFGFAFDSGHQYCKLIGTESPNNCVLATAVITKCSS